MVVSYKDTGSVAIVYNPIQELQYPKQLAKHEVTRPSLEGRNDLRVGGVGDLVAHLAEALDVLAEGLARILAHGTEVVVHEAALVRALEVGDKAPADIFPGVDGVSGEVGEP